jgi:phage terminase large subunit-like protein
LTARSTASWTTWPLAERLRLLARLKAEAWRRQARPEQLDPGDEHRVWYLQGGRGSGKSRTGAETLAGWILSHDPGEWAVVAPTFGDARDICVESAGGLLSALEGVVETYNRSTGYIRVANGSEVYLDGADDGAFRVQGHNLRGIWCDEVGLWRNWQVAWSESIFFAMRLAPGRIVATGTPKAGHGLVKELLEDPATKVTRMRTIDNAANLHPAALEELLRRFEGKRLGRQELDAEFIEDVEGALWNREQLEKIRIDPQQVPPLRRIVVAVDPNTTSGEAANDAGIIVAGEGQSVASEARQHGERYGYVIADRTTTSGGPRAWARAAVDAYYEFEADRIVAEVNNGGEMFLPACVGGREARGVLPPVEGSRDTVLPLAGQPWSATGTRDLEGRPGAPLPPRAVEALRSRLPAPGGARGGGSDGFWEGKRHPSDGPDAGNWTADS